jgi:hypothetical protein
LQNVIPACQKHYNGCGINIAVGITFWESGFGLAANRQNNHTGIAKQGSTGLVKWLNYTSVISSG